MVNNNQPVVPSWIEHLWPRGKTSAGWRKVDRAIDYYYDGLFYANHADTDWMSGNNPTFYSYVYKVRTYPGGDSLGWAPFDPDDPPDSAQMTFSYVVNTLDPAAAESHATERRAFRVSSREGRWVFELPAEVTPPLLIEIYNVVGRRVRGMRIETSDEVRRGTYWNGEDSGGRRVASGVCFARLREAGGPARRSGQVTRLLVVH